MPAPSRLLLALVAAGALCRPAAAADRGDTVRGDGHKTTEQRQVDGFSRIELRTHVDVQVTEGPAHAVAVTIDRNLQPYLTTSVEGDRLVIGSSRSMGYGGAGKVVVSLPELRGFALEGSGDVRIAGADKNRDVELAIDGSGDLAWSGRAGKIEAHIRGSGGLRISGAAGRLEAVVEGSGDIAARDLAARSARVEVAGSGDVAVTVDGGALAANVDGSGDIQWWGQAKVEAASVRGSGSIRHR